jgi:dTDP-4-dehydrorhamnose 3,5-epimerase
MKVIPTQLDGVVLIEPQVFRDDRGRFLETYSERAFAEAGLPTRFAQDNLSYSKKGVLRGLHYQHPVGQGKLVWVVQGQVFDVAVDIRRGSPTFRQWFGAVLSAENHRRLYIPEGFAHGFYVTSDEAIFSYKCTNLYHPKMDGSILWNDPEIGIEWPLAGEPMLSAKDASAARLREITADRLPA